MSLSTLSGKTSPIFKYMLTESGAMVWTCAFVGCRSTGLHCFPLGPYKTQLMRMATGPSRVQEIALNTYLALRALTLGITEAGASSSNYYDLGTTMVLHVPFREFWSRKGLT